MITEILNFFDNLVVSSKSESFLVVKIVSGTFSLFLFILILAILKRYLKIAFVKQQISAVEDVFVKPDEIIAKWEKIQNIFKRGDETNLKMAIIEADKLIDEILKKANFPGEDMGQRLENINSAQLSTIDDLWRAHKVRNKIAHEANFKLTTQEAQNVISAYEKTLKELQII